MSPSNDRRSVLAALTRTVGLAIATAGLLFSSAASVAASGASGAADHGARLALLMLVLLMAALVSAVVFATRRPARRTVSNDKD
jgi:hypothetical protein